MDGDLWIYGYCSVGAEGTKAPHLFLQVVILQWLFGELEVQIGFSYSQASLLQLWA